MAQLVTNGKHLGPHPFIVPLRNFKTREPLPGRMMGDIGPKVGINAVDNGYLGLHNVRIPHINMLARFSSVDPATGLYNAPKRPQLAYGSMTAVRARVIKDASTQLARAATVATRYCAIRKQFKQEKLAKGLESQVLDYQSVQYRIFPVIAAVFAFHFTGSAIYAQSLENSERLSKGDLSMMAEMHASTCALKSYATIFTADSIERCRRACGGHGYSVGSGLSVQLCVCS
jgi:acyl-CoA oxidase